MAFCVKVDTSFSDSFIFMHNISLGLDVSNSARAWIAMAMLVLSTAVPQISSSQGLGLDQGFVNRYAPPGSSTIQVYIWGSVATPGIWRIQPSLDLVELLSAVRVTGVGQDQPGFNQQVRLRIYRTTGGDRREIYEERLDNVLAEGASYPTLQEGDVLEVETQQRRSFLEKTRTITGLVGSAASLILLYLRITEGR